MNRGKRDAAYWRYRVERDYPEIAARLRSGELPSVRAAAIEAGLLRDPSPLDELRRAWRKASAEHRAAFIGEIPPEAWPAPVIAPPRDIRRKPAAEIPLDQGELFSGGKPPAAMNENILPAGGNAAASGANDKDPVADDAVPARGLERDYGAGFGSGAGDRRGGAALRADMQPSPRHDRDPASDRTAAQHRAPEIASAPDPLAAAAAYAGHSPQHRADRQQDAALQEPEEEAPEEEFPAEEFPEKDFNEAASYESEAEVFAETVERRPNRPVPSNGAAHGRRELPEIFKLGRTEVGVGQEYIKLDAGPDPWQVLSIFAGPGDVPHARIVRLSQPDEVRVVSLAALIDRHRYRPI